MFIQHSASETAPHTFSWVRLRPVGASLLPREGLHQAGGCLRIHYRRWKEKTKRGLTMSQSTASTDTNSFEHVGLLPVPENALSDDELLRDLLAWLAAHSALTYTGDRIVGRELKRAGFEEVVHFRHRGTAAYLARCGSVWVLAFRGTENDYNDILVDITLFKRTADYKTGYRAHGGFLTALQSLWGGWGRRDNPDSSNSQAFEQRFLAANGIADIVYKHVKPSHGLYVTGHSLGGALAHLAAFYIHRDFHREGFAPIRAVATFGAPRATDKAMARSLDEQPEFPVLRVINGSDLVPRVPPALTGFRHFGQRPYIHRSGEFHSDRSFSLWRDWGPVRLASSALVLLLVFVVLCNLFGTFGFWTGVGLLAVGGILWAALGGLLLRFIPLHWIPAGIRNKLFHGFRDHGIAGYVNGLARHHE